MNDRIAELENEIRRHKDLYYRGCPEISDVAFDALEAELKRLDPDNAVLHLVGSSPSGSNKVAHAVPMLSLEKTYEMSDLIKWIQKRPVVATFKMDGMSASLVYESGRLVMAKTRGDGEVGENITDKVCWMESVPQRLSISGNVEIRGEIVCEEGHFFSLSDEMESLKLERPSAQRNIVAGLMGRKDHIALSRYLSFFAFDILGVTHERERDKVDTLQRLGLQSPPTRILEAGETPERLIDDVREFMEEGHFQIDGIVFTLDEIALHDELGMTAHHPRYKLAYKFAGETQTSTIENIEWNVSRNGILTPVAIVSPVELSGAMITRVTLHNLGMVQQYQLKRGDQIEIIRSGEVIPKFLRVVQEGQGDVDIPSHCTSCGEKVTVDGIRLACTNAACSGRRLESILHFVQKIGIEDLSSKRLNEMIQRQILSSIPDLYRLTEEQLLTLDKVKERLASKLIYNIQKTKTVKLSVFLSALGISGGAENKCERLVKSGIRSMDEVKQLTLSRLTEIDGFADKSASDFLESLQSKHALIDELLFLGIQIVVDESAGRHLAGISFCITGALSVDRKIIEREIKESGGQVVSSVSKKTNYLVTNETASSSSKFQKAKELGVPIVNEAQLKTMIEKR